MMRFFLAASLLLFGQLVSASPSADVAWQAQFANAVKWSTLGINDDSGITDNTTAYNNLPANTPIIGDCPHGGYVQLNGTAFWKSGWTIWQQPGCVVKSAVTTGVAFDDQNFVNAIQVPNTNIQYYGMQFAFITQTNSVRFTRVWIDHFKFKYFSIDNTGGFMFLRGSDQEIAYGTLTHTFGAPGNPGIRHIGNVPLVPTSPGMRANVWVHDVNFQTGDAVFQACQPLGTALWVNVNTDGVLYENSTGVSTSSSVILANEPVTPSTFSNFSCNNVTYRNITGSGIWGALISSGGDFGQTNNVLIDRSTLTGSHTSLPPILAGDFTAGGATSTGAAANVTVSNSHIFGVTAQPFQQINVTNFQFPNNTYN